MLNEHYKVDRGGTRDEKCQCLDAYSGSLPNLDYRLTCADPGVAPAFTIEM